VGSNLMGGVTFPVDPAVREAMSVGSGLLLAAIAMARVGLDPNTSPTPVGLPPKWKPAPAPKPHGDTKKRVQKIVKAQKLRKLDVFAEYLAEGYEPEQAAEIMGYWHGRQGNALLQRLRAELGPQAV
jgi:hypothetical protein